MRRDSGEDKGDDPDNRTETKGKYQQPKSDDRILVIKAALHGLYSDGWTQNSIVTIVAFLVAPLLTYMWLQSPKGMLYGFGLGATIALWGLILAVAKHIESPQIKTPASSMNEPIQNNNITSTNQTGGFTGINTGTVNVGPKARHITQEQRDAFINSVRYMPKGAVDISTVHRDEEVLAYAGEIRSMFTSAGYSGIGVSFQIRSVPDIVGIYILIKDKDSEPPFAGAVQKAMQSIGIECFAEYDRQAPANEVQILVGRTKRP